MKLVSIYNSKLAKDGIVSINMPPVLTCPSAGICKAYCYAQVGQQAMGKAKQKRLDAYNMFMNNPDEFQNLVISELLQANRRIVRWNDSGDIINKRYLEIMCNVAKHYPDIKFYAYTKSIPIIIDYGWHNIPNNLKLIQSYGGLHDGLIDRNRAFAQVFKDKVPSDYIDCSTSDYEAATSANKIGMIVHGNRKKQFKE